MDFESIRESVSAAQAAEYYGLDIKGGRAACPFHNGKDRNLSFKGGRFHCFVCGKSGDSIQYVADLFRISRYEASKKLNADFHLGLDGKLSPEEQRKVDEAAQKRAAEREAARRKETRRNRLALVLRIARQSWDKESVSGAEWLAIKNYVVMDYVFNEGLEPSDKLTKVIDYIIDHRPEPVPAASKVYRQCKYNGD